MTADNLFIQNMGAITHDVKVVEQASYDIALRGLTNATLAK